MAKKEITIAFRHGGILPASIIGAKEDKRVPAHEAVSVPEAYGHHLIEDRFAYEVDAEAAPARKAKQAVKPEAGAIAAAEQAVVDATAKVEAAGDDLVAKADAEAELKAAEEALAALKG